MLTFNVAYLVVLVDAYRRTQIIARTTEIARTQSVAEQPLSNRLRPQDPLEFDNPLPHQLFKCFDDEIRDHLQHVIEELHHMQKQQAASQGSRCKLYFSISKAKMGLMNPNQNLYLSDKLGISQRGPQTSRLKQKGSPRSQTQTGAQLIDQVIVELIGMSLREAQQSQQCLFSLLYFFLSIVTHYEIVDYIYDIDQTHLNSKSSSGKDEDDEKQYALRLFYSRILYNLQTVVLLMFDHDNQL